MCCCKKNKDARCEKPENLKDKPEECTPQQIRECHGDAKKHSCTTKAEK